MVKNRSAADEIETVVRKRQGLRVHLAVLQATDGAGFGTGNGFVDGDIRDVDTGDVRPPPRQVWRMAAGATTVFEDRFSPAGLSELIDVEGRALMDDRIEPADGLAFGWLICASGAVGKALVVKLDFSDFSSVHPNVLRMQVVDVACCLRFGANDGGAGEFVVRSQELRMGVDQPYTAGCKQAQGTEEGSAELNTAGTAPV